MTERVKFERDYWDSIPRTGDDFEKYLFDDNFQETFDAIVPYVAMAKSVLEIGSGTGRLLFPLAKKFPETIFYGVDISKEITDIAVSRSDAANVSLFIGDGRKLLSLYRSLDLVYCVTVFQHLSHDGIESYITEVSTTLVPGGIFRFQFIEGKSSEPFSNHYELREIEYYLGDNGFTIMECQVGLVHEQWTWITARRDDDN